MRLKLASLALLVFLGSVATAQQQPGDPSGAARSTAQPAQPGAQPAEASPTAATQPAQGEPLKIRAAAIYDIRIGHVGTPINDRRSQFQLITRIEGPAIPDVTRMSFPVFEEFSTDTGEHLVDYAKRRAHEGVTHPYSRPGMIRQSTFIDVPFDVDVRPTRSAAKLARVAGHVLVVLGGPVEPVWLPHAKRFEGGYLEHPRLEQLGIRIRMLSLAEAPELADGRSYALVIESGDEHIRNIAAYDPWLRNTRVQATQAEHAGQRYTVFTIYDQDFTRDWELAVYTFPEPETLRLDFDFVDLDLP